MVAKRAMTAAKDATTKAASRARQVVDAVTQTAALVGSGEPVDRRAPGRHTPEPGISESTVGTAPATKRIARKRSAAARKAAMTEAPVTPGVVDPDRRTSEGPAPEAQTTSPELKQQAQATVGVAAADTQPAPESTGGSGGPGGSGAPRTAAYVVREDEAPWTEEELRAVRTELEDGIAALRNEVERAEHDIIDLLRDSGDGAGDDQADAGTKTYEREQEIALAGNAREMLRQNEHALKRLDDGSYGVCESCGEPIGKMRLQAAPRATLCMSCKRKQERR